MDPKSAFHPLDLMIELFEADHILGKVNKNETEANKPRTTEMIENNEFHVGGIVHAELPNRKWNTPTVYYVRWWGMDLDQGEWIPAYDMTSDVAENRTIGFF